MASQESKTTSSSSEELICDSCKYPVHEEKNMGCCEGGENGRCPHTVWRLCDKCGTWDEEMEIWRCPPCQTKYEKDFPEKVKKSQEPGASESQGSSASK